jgi:hypothetical protein
MKFIMDKTIRAILKQLKQYQLLQEIINPIATADDFRSSFQHVPEKTASSPSVQHVGHYKECIDPNNEHTVLLAEVHAALMTIPLATGYCPERWRQAVDVILEKIPGISKTNKLWNIQILEADFNQVLRCAFTRNISKIANNTPGVISAHQYGRSGQTCMTPVLNKLLTVQLLIQKKSSGIVQQWR